MQSDASSSDSGNNPNLSDDQKLIGKPPLPSILKPPSASRPSRKNNTVIEVELAALAAVTALSVISPANHNDVDDNGNDDKRKEKKRNDQSNQGSPELPMHLRPSLSLPPSPVTSPHSTPKRYVEDNDDLGTLAFMAGRGFDNDFEDESMKPIVKIAEKKQKHVRKAHNTTESDPMDCSTLVAMAGINSVIESYEPIKNETVDRATSPTIPAHLVTEASNVNTNNNNNNATNTVVIEKASVGEEEETKKLKEQHRAQLLTQYHHVLCEKKLKRTGSVGSIASRLSLPSALSLIPESHVPASRGVTDKISSEFPLLTGNNAAVASVNLVGMSASATGVVVVTEEPVKRVSFQDLSPSPAAGNGVMPVSAGESQRLIGRPLPARPLPPIGGGADANLFSEGNFPTMSPRSGNNRPLPPLNGMGMGNGNSVVYDTMSLHSAGSSTHILYKTGSTNSLPNPDPRYIRGHLHKLMGGTKRKTPPPPAATPVYPPLPTSASMGISNIGVGRLSPHQAL